MFAQHRLAIRLGIAATLVTLAGGASAQTAPPGGAIVTQERLLADFATPAAVPPTMRWLTDSRNVLLSFRDGGDSRIERMDVETGRRERLVEGSDPVPSPDGSAIAYLSGKGSARQLSIYTFADGKSRTIADIPGGTIGHTLGFAWSPDGKRIAYGFRAEKARKPAVVDPNAPSVVVVGEGGDIPPDTEVWVAELASGARRRMTSGAFLFSYPDWLDNSAFLFSEGGSVVYKGTSVTSRIAAVSTATAEVRTLLDKIGVQGLRAIVSPDRRQVAFRYDPNNNIFPFYYNIATVPAEGGPIKQLTRNLYIAGSPIWSGDSKRLYFLGKTGVFTQIYSVTTAGQVKQITNAPRNAANIAVSPSGDRLIWATEDAYGRSDVRVARSDGSGERVLADLAPKAKGLALGDVEELRWKSKDGLEISGLLIKPLGYQPGKRYPLLVNVHGGPQGGVYLWGEILLSSPLEWQMWAAKGYAVFVPDYRGSTVPGWDPVLKAREDQDANPRDMDDVMSGVDHVIAMGIADPDRLALLGHSAGSQLTNWMITHTSRFKVAVSYEGWAESYVGYGAGLRVGGNSSSEWYRKGKPWEVPENYRAHDAVNFVKGVTTPTMFISGDYGGENGVENLYNHEFMWTALKQQGVDTQMLIYRNEDHVIKRPVNQKDLLKRIVDWIDARIKP